MQSFSFAPPSGPPREGHKNYVFVDEHNRHKRLKVMRACNGCRKRKIKCDAATTNTWPCSACTRLKLVCVPPTIGQDSEFPAGQVVEADGPTGPLGASSAPQASHHAYSIPPDFRDNGQPPMANMPSYSESMGVFPQWMPPPPPHSQPTMYGDVRSPPLSEPQPHQYQQQQQPMFATTPTQPLETTDNSLYMNNEQSTAENLSEVLGELKIDETGIAPYIRRQKKDGPEPEVPVQDDAAEERLPPLSTGAGSAIRIPPELMPPDDEVMGYFKIYFNEIHPYVPVIPRSHLYYQWQNDRSSISPLLLEALFACAGRSSSDDLTQGAQWLAMANRHESSFMDVPRLSTIQAMLLLLKARESLPKKGYYYRSWQMVKTIVSMAKDLDIHEHYGVHAEGGSCDLQPMECLVQTRVWQVLLIVEVMIGAPQGRSDYGVDLGTVDMRPTLDIKGLDQFEIDRSRQYAYFVRNANNIRIVTEIYHKVKRQKDWGADPRFMENNHLISNWLQSLPPDLMVDYPDDGSPPWIPSHFVANMHSHCHLVNMLIHRPQLLASKSFDAEGSWKVHFSLCYSSAKSLCRLQEAILANYGLSGLLYMQRGINFAIYCILTCTMLHLIAITSPDPQFHTDARAYFTRHMRILEQCSTAWPMPEIQAQIDSLRLAFSADTNRPFELKSTFPYGSPSEPYYPSPPPFDSSHYTPPLNQVTGSIPSRVGYSTYPISPPISTGTEDAKSESSHLQPLGMITPHPVSNPSMEAPLVDESSWDPTRIINQWDMAFSVDPAAVTTNSPPMNLNSTVQGLQQPLTAHYPTVQYDSPTKMTPVTPAPAMSQAQPQFNPRHPMITARDWQQSVASVFDPHGLKRRWNNYSVDMGMENSSKRQR